MRREDLADRRVGRLPRSTICWKTGVSSSWVRIHRPKATSTPESRNATRQPQDSNAASLSSSGQERRARRWPAGCRRRADLGGGGPEAAGLRLAELRGQQHRTAPLAADADALGEAQHDQQDRREDADLAVGGQDADQEGGHTDQHQGPDQHLLAADQVAEAAEDDAAERPGDVADGVGGERQQGAGERVVAREEEVTEDQGGGGAVDREVVPLQRCCRSGSRRRPGPGCGGLPAAGAGGCQLAATHRGHRPFLGIGCLYPWWL